MAVHPGSGVDEILRLLNSAGEMEYGGEQVSQLEHALQCAQNAQMEDGTEDEIIAALLHDIGHIWPTALREVTSVGVVHHDAIGAQVLTRLGFSEAVAEIVSGHVQAKRFLVSSDKEYAALLSVASVASLKLQGGPMSSAEAEAFSQSSYCRQKVRVRIWDDRAKIPGAQVPGLESYRELLMAHLSRQEDRPF